MTDEKIEAMFQLIHMENKLIMTHVLAMQCYPKDFDEAMKHIDKTWDESFKEILRIE